ncbi:MAG: hypothetical protein ACLGPL_02310 [Acidobacteriota bacterium]
MDRKTQWLSLIAGVMLLIMGVSRLVSNNEWVLLVISVLIIAFSVSSIMKSKAGK